MSTNEELAREAAATLDVAGFTETDMRLAQIAILSALNIATAERDREIARLRADKERMDWLLANAEIDNPQNCSESWDTRQAIDQAMRRNGGEHD